MNKIANWIIALLLFLLSSIILLLFTAIFPIKEALIRYFPILISFFAILWVNNYLLIPRLLTKMKWKTYLFLSLLLCFFLTIFRATIETKFGLKVGTILEPLTKNARSFYLLFVFLTNLVSTIISLASYFGKKWIESSKREATLKSEKLEAELSLLKSQVNPHFLFNTLNNIYTLCYLNDKRAAETVLKLAEMMRYLIYECVNKEVLLKKEIRFLESYLELQKLKSLAFGRIRLETDKLDNTLLVPPLLLLPFFENIFKHSDLETNPNGYVNAKLKIIDGSKISLMIENTFVPKTDKSNEGFGIRNVKNRLDLIFRKNYQLEMKDDDNIFTIKLEIPL